MSIGKDMRRLVAEAERQGWRIVDRGQRWLCYSLDGETIFPVAEELQRRGIPFIFATGYGESILPEKWRGQLHLGKPFNREQLEKLIRSISGT